jgi:hypothetical protein
MSNVAIADWMFPQQQAGIPTQLEDGVRALLIDVHYGFPGGSRIKTDLSERRPTRETMTDLLGQEGVDAALRIRDRLVGVDEGQRGLYLCHGFCELGASELGPTLRTIRDFLVRRPGEVLLVVVEDYVSPRDLAAVFEESGLAERVYRGPSGPPWPTLRELVESGENAIVFLESGNGGVDWLRPAFELIQETPYTFHAPGEFSCRPNRGSPSAGLFLVNHWIETTPTPLPSNAAIVNARAVLLTRARECAGERGMLPNILAVDFYRSGDLFGVVDTLNRVTAGDLRDGDPDLDDRSPALAVEGFRRSRVGLDHLLRQAQPHAAVVGLGVGDEGLEDLVPDRGGPAGAGVRNADHDRASLTPAVHAHAAALRRSLHRVANDVLEGALQAGSVQGW